MTEQTKDTHPKHITLNFGISFDLKTTVLGEMLQALSDEVLDADLASYRLDKRVTHIIELMKRTDCLEERMNIYIKHTLRTGMYEAIHDEIKYITKGVTMKMSPVSVRQK